MPPCNALEAAVTSLMIVVAVLGATACAATARARVGEPPDLITALARGDRLVDDGCYACLQEAFSIYDAHKTRSPVARRRTFSTAVLLALREKELGLPASTWIDTATHLAEPADQPYLDILSAVPWAATAVPDYPTGWHPDAAAVARWRAFVGSSSLNSALDNYLTLTLECRLPGGAGLDAIRPGFSHRELPPLLRYAVGLCGSAHRQDLADVLAADPRFAEAAFALGLYEIGTAITNRHWIRTTLPFLHTAHAAFGRAHVITITLAGVVRARNDLPGALVLYDEALALRPMQSDALLGRVITLGYLGRYQDAIADATRLIEIGTRYQGDAYYWRAWNYYQQRDLPSAETNIASAKGLLQNGDVFTLSGIIAYEQNRREDARRDFREVRRIASDRCVPAWYLGLIEGDDRAWAESVREFTRAATCYDEAVKALRTELAALPADLEPTEQARQTSDLDRRIRDNGQQADRSRRNADIARARLPPP